MRDIDSKPKKYVYPNRARLQPFIDTIKGMELRPGIITVDKGNGKGPFITKALFTYYTDDAIMWVAPNTLDPWNANNARHCEVGKVLITDTDISTTSRGNWKINMKLNQQAEWIDELVAEFEKLKEMSYEEGWWDYLLRPQLFETMKNKIDREKKWPKL